MKKVKLHASSVQNGVEEPCLRISRNHAQGVVRGAAADLNLPHALPRLLYVPCTIVDEQGHLLLSCLSVLF